MAKKKKEEIVYRFNVGVDVDPSDAHAGAHYSAGEEVGAESVPSHIDLQTLIEVGAIRPVEEK